MREPGPADSQILFDSLFRVWAIAGRKVGAVVTERAFFSAANRRALAQLRERMKDKRFARLQRRRAQTEGRFGILKHGSLGRPLRAKGFAHRELAQAWGVLTHNLCMLARMRCTKKKAVPIPKAV